MEHYVFISHSSLDKTIANAICNYLESNGIRCWIAPRDIDTSDWAGSIMDGLRKSNVFVVIVSQNSAGSAEVNKEVTLATQCCRYILPFRVDKEDLSDHMKYHLSPCHWLDAVTPPLEQRIGELYQRILHLSDKDAVYANQFQRKLTERIAWPKSLFVGRDEEIEEIAQHFLDQNVLFLQGMGGIGKSEIAKTYAKRYRDRYDTIVFAGYTGSILDTVISDAIPIENLTRGSADTESKEHYFARKMEVLRNITNSRTLLILDNFDVEEDPYLPELMAGNYHLLITTRCEPQDYRVLKIDKIRDFDQVRQIFITHYGRKLNDADMAIIDRMLKLVNCHTITVELIAKQMKASHRKAADMLKLLEATGTNTKLREKVRHNITDAGLSAFDYIREMFHVSALSEQEKQILCNMSLVPHTGIDFSTFADWSELDEYDDINSLIARSWLVLDEDTDMLMLHPVICDVVRAEMAPTPASCRTFVHGIFRGTKDCWYFTTEERNRIAPYFAFIQKHFPEPCPELWEEYLTLVNSGWICGDFERSQKNSHVVYDYAMRNFGPNNNDSARAAFYVATAYHNSGDDVTAEPYYKLALEYWSESQGDYRRLLANCCSKVGRSAYMRGDYVESKLYLDRAMAIYEDCRANPKDAEEARVLRYLPGDTVVEYERLYMEQGQYEKALEYCQKSYDMFLFIKDGEEVPNHAYSLVDMGICYSKLKDYAKAEHYLQRALDVNIRFNGVASRQTVRTREAIADNAFAKGDLAQAREQYLELELDLERDFGPANPLVLQIRKKREAIA